VRAVGLGAGYPLLALFAYAPRACGDRRPGPL